VDATTKGVILAVDDTPENLGVLFDYLDEVGFTVLLVQNGENALKQAEENLPDLILLDIMMPDLDGFEVCRRLKASKLTRDIPVIFMTALSDTADKVRGFAAGGVDYITKPLQHEEVVERVRTHTTIRRLQRELQEKNTILQEYVELLAEKNTELDEKNALLEKVNASKDRFFSIISHDLRSPFVGLLGLTQLISEEFEQYSREKLHTIVTKLHKSTENLYALIENLLTWSRLQRGMIECRPQPIIMRDAVQRTINILNANAEQKAITLSNAIATDVVGYADSKMLDTVLRNLISNALKFTNKDGTITISLEQQEEILKIAVADTGIGISREHLSKLFRIDSKYTRTGTANERGTGLGLILCKEFVERNGGAIEVESKEGSGTTFSFTLPVAPTKQNSTIDA
jgi:signal transduction histidine kinase